MWISTLRRIQPVGSDSVICGYESASVYSTPKDSAVGIDSGALYSADPWDTTTPVTHHLRRPCLACPAFLWPEPILYLCNTGKQLMKRFLNSAKKLVELIIPLKRVLSA